MQTVLDIHVHIMLYFFYQVVELEIDDLTITVSCTIGFYTIIYNKEAIA